MSQKKQINKIKKFQFNPVLVLHSLSETTITNKNANHNNKGDTGSKSQTMESCQQMLKGEIWTRHWITTSHLLRTYYIAQAPCCTVGYIF